MKFEEFSAQLKEDPLKALLAGLIILFWLAGPFVAQRIFDISAIKISFAITVFYFVAWKLWKF